MDWICLSKDLGFLGLEFPERCISGIRVDWSLILELEFEIVVVFGLRLNREFLGLNQKFLGSGSKIGFRCSGSDCWIGCWNWVWNWD